MKKALVTLFAFGAVICTNAQQRFGYLYFSPKVEGISELTKEEKLIEMGNEPGKYAASTQTIAINDSAQFLIVYDLSLIFDGSNRTPMPYWEPDYCKQYPIVFMMYQPEGRERAEDGGSIILPPRYIAVGMPKFLRGCENITLEKFQSTGNGAFQFVFKDLIGDATETVTIR